MRPISKGILASLVFHLALLCLFHHLQLVPNLREKTIYITLPDHQKVPLPAPLLHERQTPKRVGLFPANREPVLSGKGARSELSLQNDSVLVQAKIPSASPMDIYELNKDGFLIKKYLLNQTRGDSQKDSIDHSKTNLSIFQKAANLPISPYSDDRIHAGIYRRNLGQMPPMPLSGIVKEISRYLHKAEPTPPPRLALIPSAVEIEAFCVIWQQKQSTDQEIFSRLDSSTRVTAEDLNQVLEGMVQKGLLTRQIVSPRNELSIGTPMGEAGIELSAQNRRNRIYRYQSLVTSEHMMQFLQAKLYQVKNRTHPLAVLQQDSLHAEKDIQKKIVKIVKKTGTGL